MQSLNGRIGSKIRLKWTVPWFSVFVDQTNLKIIWKFSLSQYRCHKTPIDVENCIKSALNSNHIIQNFTVITNWGGGDYQFRSALAAKQIWVAVMTIWGTLASLPRQALTSVLCLLFSPKTVHCSTKNAYTSELTFLALVSWNNPSLF